MNLLMTEQQSKPSTLHRGSLYHSTGPLPFVRHEVLRQIEILRNASNSILIVNIESCHHVLASCLALCTNIFPAIKLCAEEKKTK